MQREEKSLLRFIDYFCVSLPYDDRHSYSLFQHFPPWNTTVPSINGKFSRLFKSRTRLNTRHHAIKCFFISTLYFWFLLTPYQQCAPPLLQLQFHDASVLKRLFMWKVYKSFLKTWINYIHQFTNSSKIYFATFKNLKMEKNVWVFCVELKICIVDISVFYAITLLKKERKLTDIQSYCSVTSKDNDEVSGPLAKGPSELQF